MKKVNFIKILGLAMIVGIAIVNVTLALSTNEYGETSLETEEVLAVCEKVVDGRVVEKYEGTTENGCTLYFYSDAPFVQYTVCDGQKEEM